MIVGLPRETKEQENRIALTPEACRQVIGAGHTVLVQSGAGAGSGFADAAYAAAGAHVMATAAEVYGQADLAVKVKAPLPVEYGWLRPRQAIFGYLHLVVEPALTDLILEHRITAIDYETVQAEDGSLPLLAPMSEIAGKMAVQVAARLLERNNGGSGKLLGGAAGVPACRVLILGGGTAGGAAARLAVGMEARVTMISGGEERPRALQRQLPGLETAPSDPATIAAAVAASDVLIAAASVPGARAPRLVSRQDVAAMAPGSVIVCVNADDGGVVETCRHTTHANPTFIEEGAIHYCVPNMPGAVPVTATQALSAAVLPYVLRIAERGVVGAVTDEKPAAKALMAGVTVHNGHVTHPGLAAALGKPYLPVSQVLASTASGHS